MLIVHVKPGCVEAFKTASIENARHSIQEPGIARFDIAQEPDDPARFVLIEVYRDADGPAGTRKQRTTKHGATRWLR
jgi:autoinducer 2-degrading protein